MWYYHLRSSDNENITYFVDYRRLSHEERNLLEIDNGYRSEEARLADASYQMWQKGLMKNDLNLQLNINPQKKSIRNLEIFKGTVVRIDDSVFITDIEDNYRFIRRYFNVIHSYYILFLRLFSLNNPFREIWGFCKAFKVKRIDPCRRNVTELDKADYDKFESRLLKVRPKVSVIIPTLNRYEYLKDVLADLEKQDYNNFEVIVCDQTKPLDRKFYEGWKFPLKLIEQEDEALWLARNRSIKDSTGEYILLFDDDSRVDPDWISSHLKCIDYYKCDISSGISLSRIGGKIPLNYSYFRWGDQVDTGNVMFYKQTMLDTGMFDRQFERQRQGDGEYGLRAYLCGMTNVSNPLAKRIHLKVSTGGLRQTGNWDALRPTKFFAPRPVPSILYLSRKYFGNNKARLLLLINMPSSVVPYKYKDNRKKQLLYMLSFVVTFPVIVAQAAVSWHKASLKLKEGDKIERL